MIEWHPIASCDELRERAEFLQSQFGVQTMAEYGCWFARQTDDADVDQEHCSTLHTLGEDETIARLATGIKRFKLPDEHNYIKLYQQIADGQRRRRRRRGRRAHATWRRTLRTAGSIRARPSCGSSCVDGAVAATTNYADRLHQIIGNWGQFEAVMTQPAGRGATLDFRFRNAKRVEFIAQRSRSASCSTM